MNARRIKENKISWDNFSDSDSSKEEEEEECELQTPTPIHVPLEITRPLPGQTVDKDKFLPVRGQQDKDLLEKFKYQTEKPEIENTPDRSKKTIVTTNYRIEDYQHRSAISSADFNEDHQQFSFRETASWYFDNAFQVFKQSFQ